MRAGRDIDDAPKITSESEDSGGILESINSNEASITHILDFFCISSPDAVPTEAIVKSTK